MGLSLSPAPGYPYNREKVTPPAQSQIPHLQNGLMLYSELIQGSGEVSGWSRAVGAARSRLSRRLCLSLQPLVREPCRSCAVVSSSGQMLGSGLGAEIDSAECVLRMNQAPTVGFEADVGRRSTLRVVSHTSVPLLLRNYSHYFQHARDTLYVVWGQGRHMDRALGGRTYRTLLQLTRMYPGLQVYTFTERMMAYCDQVFQDETGKNR